jgi:hypothetical protein
MAVEAAVPGAPGRFIARWQPHFDDKPAFAGCSKALDAEPEFRRGDLEPDTVLEHLSHASNRAPRNIKRQVTRRNLFPRPCSSRCTRARVGSRD